MREGAWVAFYWDFSGLALFNAYEELEARRYAAERSMEVEFVPFGRDVRQFLLITRGTLTNPE